MLEAHFNGWTEVTFCLAQKVHKAAVGPGLMVDPDELRERVFESVRPYHALLLLQPAEELAAELPLDHCTDARKIIESALPTRPLAKLALDLAMDEQFVSAAFPYTRLLRSTT